MDAYPRIHEKKNTISTKMKLKNQVLPAGATGILLIQSPFLLLQLVNHWCCWWFNWWRVISPFGDDHPQVDLGATPCGSYSPQNIPVILDKTIGIHL